MKKTNKKILGFIALGVVALIGVNVVLAQSQTNQDQLNITKVHNPQTLKQRQDISNAINSDNYSAWVTAESENGKHPRILDKINQTDFPTYVAYYAAIKDKDKAAAKTLAEELGFRFGQHNSNGKHPDSIKNWRTYEPSVNNPSN